MGHDRYLRPFLFAVPLICHLVTSAAWMVAHHPAITCTASSCRLASSRSNDEEVIFPLERSPSVNSTSGEKEAVTFDLQANHPARSDARTGGPTVPFSFPAQGQQRLDTYSYGGGKGYKSRRKNKSQSWNIEEQQQVYATITELLQRDAPESPSEIISQDDIARANEIIKAWSLSGVDSDPSGAYDDELYRAIFSQEPDYFIVKAQEEEYLKQKKREYKGPSPERQWQIDVQDERREATRLKLMESMADFMRELEQSEEKLPIQLKCRKCKCSMTSHSAALQGQLCQVCYADSLANAAKNEPVKERRQYFTNPNLRSYNPPMEQPIRQRPRRAIGDRKVMAFGDLINGILENVDTDGEETKKSSVMEENDPDERSSSSPWCEMTDPDTGKTFYWNEETEEVKWEL